MLQRAALALGSFLVLLPLLAHAEETTVWDFRNKQVPGQWTVKNVTSVQPTVEGLHIRTQEKGMLWRSISLPHPLDVVTIVLTADHPVEASMLWHARGEPEQRLSQMFWEVEEGNTLFMIDIAPGSIAGWDPSTNQLGFSFPAGTNVMIQEIRLRHWSFLEKLQSAIKSFWTFDTFRPYSINFLWGPLLAFNAPEIRLLFLRLPPLAISAMRLFYVLLAIVGVGGIIFTFLSRDSATVTRRALAAFGGTAIALWIFFDARMGLEILTYAATDYQTYVRPRLGEKRLRTHAELYDVLERALPILQSVPRYALAIESGSPTYQNLRYLSYPSLPYLPGEDTASIGLLFVYHRPDITLREDKVLASDGTTIVENGRLIADFGSGSFLYGSTH